MNDPGRAISRRALLAAALGACARPSPPHDDASSSAAVVPAPTIDAAAPPPRCEHLAERFPELAAATPRVRLGAYPSRVESTPELAAELGLKGLWIKRDDLASPVFGGSKTRKLELLLARALADGHDTVVTFGAAGSNQAVATARFGARLGLKVVLYLAPQVPGPHVRRNLVASLRAGAEIRATETVGGAEREVAARAPRAFVIPPGATTPRGDLAFVEAALELAAQVKAGACPTPDVVCVACGTGGTTAGLLVGLGLAMPSAKLLAVRASSPSTSSVARVVAAATAVVAHARSIDPAFPASARDPTALTIDGGELGRGYGFSTRAGESAMEMAARHDVRLEPVYTAKALAALHRRAPDLAGSRVLFWTTQHGAPFEEPPLSADELAALPRALRSLAG